MEEEGEEEEVTWNVVVESRKVGEFQVAWIPTGMYLVASNNNFKTLRYICK